MHKKTSKTFFENEEFSNAFISELHFHSACAITSVRKDSEALICGVHLYSLLFFCVLHEFLLFTVPYKFDGIKPSIPYWRPFVTSAPLSSMPVHAEPLRMRTNVVYFRVMRRLYRREWNWLCVNQHPWQRTRGRGEWRHTPTSYCAVMFSYPVR